MSLIVWPTPSANSYSEVAEALSWMTNRLNMDPFINAIEKTQEQALITATDLLESQQWDGKREDNSQPLAFPRTGLTDKEGVAIDGTTIPTEIMDSVYLLAILVLKDSQLQFHSGTRVTGITTSNTEIRLSYSGSAKTGKLPDNILQLIGSFLSRSKSTDLVESYGTDEVTGIEKFDLTRGWS